MARILTLNICTNNMYAVCLLPTYSVYRVNLEVNILKYLLEAHINRHEYKLFLNYLFRCHWCFFSSSLRSDFLQRISMYTLYTQDNVHELEFQHEGNDSEQLFWEIVTEIRKNIHENRAMVP